MAEVLLFHHALGLTRGCLGEYDEDAAALLTERVLRFLDNIQ